MPERLWILLPCHNGSKTIERAIDSVFEQKGIDVNYKLCIVLNNCTDETEQLIEASKYSSRIKVLKCDTQGIVPALNTGLRACLLEGATLIARQDADDKWHPKKLLYQLEQIQNNPEIDIFGSSIRYVKPDSYEPLHIMNYPATHEECVEWLTKSQNPIAHTSVIFRTKILDKCGGYDNSLPMAEDMSLWLRATLNGYKMANLPFPLIDYTSTHNPNYSPLAPQILAQFGNLVMKYFKK